MAMAAVITSNLYAQPMDPSLRSAQEPRLEVVYPSVSYVHHLLLSSSVPQKFRDFRGVLIEVNFLSELYPCLPYLFFDSGSSDISTRYNIFTDPNETVGFTDSTMLGGTIQKHHNILNIMGFRMRNNPQATIRLVGTSSTQVQIGEDRTLCRQRAERIREYLIRIWEIDPNRIIIKPSRNLHRIPAASEAADYRRVEITSSDYEIMRPIRQSDLRRYAQPDSVQFRMYNGVPNELVAYREIEIRRGDSLWHVIRNSEAVDTISSGFFWGRANSLNVDDLPTDESPYHIQLIVHTTDGRTLRSNALEIPVLIVDNEVKRRARLVDSIITRLTIIRFDFDGARLTANDKRTIREYILPEIRPTSKVLITGYTDGQESSVKLSERRARTIANALEAMRAPWEQASVQCIGNERLLYDNKLPEGRFFNRTVQLVISSPTP